MKHIILARSTRTLAVTLAACGIGFTAWGQAVEAPAPAAEVAIAVAVGVAAVVAPVPAPAVQDAAAAPAQPVQAARPGAAVFGPAVDTQRLTTSRGGAGTATQVDISGVLADTSATNVATGSNAIRDGSFANAVGFNTVIQNTGANVLIQNSMTVNVQFK